MSEDFDLEGFGLSTPSDVEQYTEDSLEDFEKGFSEEYIKEAMEETKAIDLNAIEEGSDEYINYELNEELFASKYEVQRTVELMMSRNHTKSRIMTWLMEYENLVNHINKIVALKEVEEDLEEEEVQELEKFVYEFLFQLILRKRIDILTLAGLMRGLVGSGIEAIRNAVFVLNNGLALYDPIREQFVVKVDIPEEVQEEIDRYGYPLPMITKPRWIKHNKQTGYLTLTGSLLLKGNHHDEDINVDHLNRVNRIPLRTNFDAYEHTELVWDNMEKPDDIYELGKYNKKIKAYEKFKKDANTLILMMHKLSDTYYLTHKYDKRGRVYCQGL